MIPPSDTGALTAAPPRPSDRVPDLGPGRIGYALGFALSPDGHVVLIEKVRPAWQAGHLNGVGGHIEPGETPAEAMSREFFEEAGVRLDQWSHFATIEFDAGAVWVFRTRICAEQEAQVRSCTDEPINIVPVDDVVAGHVRVVENLRWLLPLARYTHDTYVPVWAREVQGP